MGDIKVTYEIVGLKAEFLQPVLAELATLKAAVADLKGVLMTELDDLQAAVKAEDDAITALATEQATFLADIAAKLAAAGIDPALLAPITADITARVADLQALTAAQVAADPAAAAPAAEPTA